MMQTMVPKGRANYEPNSLGAEGEPPGPRECPASGFTTFPENSERNDPAEKLRTRSELFADHFSQARMFYLSQTSIEQAHMASALVFELSKVKLERVRERVMGQLRNVDENLARRVAAGLAMPLPRAMPAARTPVALKPSPALSIISMAMPTLKGRKIGILFDEGSDGAEIARLKAAIEKAGAKAMLIAPKIGELKVKGGTLKADGQLAGTPSCIVDAVALVLEDSSARKLAKEAGAVQFVMDAFGHLKAIGASPGAKALLDKAGVELDEGVTDLGRDFLKAAATRFYDREPGVRTLA